MAATAAVSPSEYLQPAASAAQVSPARPPEQFSRDAGGARTAGQALEPFQRLIPSPDSPVLWCCSSSPCVFPEGLWCSQVKQPRGGFGV